MSTGLMSCVRENSPPLEMAGSESSGAFSLPSNAADQQKRRRFHPLRNLRRIFRRRTLTNVDTAPSAASGSGSNILLGSGGGGPSSPSTSSLSQMSSSPSVIAAAGPAHSAHQIYYTKSSSSSPVDVTGMSSSAYPGGATAATAASHHHSHPHQVQHQQHLLHHHHHPQHQVQHVTIGSGGASSGIGGSRYAGTCGVSIIPPFSTSSSASGGFYIKDSREYSGIKVTNGNEPLAGTGIGCNDLEDGREMTDYQRSFSEGRLVDSDYSRDALSQSHDSVFSESVTASSLSIGLKAELFDVLRKRRNRPDASDEDLGLPRSPTTPQRKEHNTINQSEGSLSLLSMASSDLDEESSSNYGTAEKTVNSTISSKLSSHHDISTKTFASTSLSTAAAGGSMGSGGSGSMDEIDLDISAGTRLSHSAARHKMAVRPNKKKGPTRHRRPIESTVLPSTPEVNEDVFKMSTLEVKDPNQDKTKSHSLPPGVNAKILDQHSHSKATPDMSTSLNIKRSKTETTSMSSSMYTNKNISKSFDFEKGQQDGGGSAVSTLERKDEESGFFRRLLHRNSKKNKKHSDEPDMTGAPEHGEISKMEQRETSIHNEHLMDISQKIEETRKEIRKEILSEAKSGLSAMLNTFILSPDHERESNITPKINKPKSGPAARQRIIPKDLTASPLPDIKTGTEKAAIATNQFLEHERAPGPPKRSSDERGSDSVNAREIEETDDVFLDAVLAPSHPSVVLDTKKFADLRKPLPKVSSEEILIPKLTKLSSSEEQSHSMSPPKGNWNEMHFEKREQRIIAQPRIIGLSPFQQKISRAEPTTLEHMRPTPKPRKSVEKSKSFRYYSESTDAQDDKNLKRYENMPSLPDLSQPRKSYRHDLEDTPMTQSLHDPKNLSMGFVINDNNLIKLRKHEEPLPLSQGIYTKNIILTTSKPSQPTSNSSITKTTTLTSCNKNITEIEESIDKLVKAPFVSVLKKTEPTSSENVSITSIHKFETVETEEMTSIEKIRTILANESKMSDTMTKTVSMEKLSNKTEKVKTPATSMTTSTSETGTKPVVTVVEKLLATDLNDSKYGSNEKLFTPTKARRSSSIYEKNDETGVPEFMKIQLNRVDSGRPKSHIVFSKNVKETTSAPEDKEVTRRFSNESVEIADNKPVLPSETSLPPVPVPVVVKRASAPAAVVKIQQEETIPVAKSPVRKIDEENNVLRNSENTQSNQNLIERRKSVTDEKLKYEKKIEEMKSERKKSASDDIRIESRKSSVDEDTGVVLRKKSFGSLNKSSTNKEDTPELMKVFARRSLKIKDPEDVPHVFEESEKTMSSTIITTTTTTTSSLKRTANIDSDKENHSSSEEKLDKLPKVEITIQPKSSLQNGHKLDDKNRTSTIGEIYRSKPIPTLAATTAKPFVPPTRFGNVTNYRNTTTTSSILEMKKTIETSTSTSSTSTASPTINVGNEPNNNSNANIINNNSNNNNNSFTNNKAGIRHTIGTTTPIVVKVDNQLQIQGENSGEFKGILQRRAEWEKRAKEASK